MEVVFEDIDYYVRMKEDAFYLERAGGIMRILRIRRGVGMFFLFGCNSLS